MKLPIKVRCRRLLSFAAPLAMLAMSIPADAQFGGVVFDPTQSAHAVQQIVNEERGLADQVQDLASGEQRNLTLAEQLKEDIALASTALNIYTQSVTTYNTIVNNLKHFSSKTLMQSLESALRQVSVQNTYGETSGLQASLNGQTQQQGSAIWKIMNLAISGMSPSFWGNQIVGASDRLSTLAHIEAMDTASANCLDAVSAYSAARQTNLTSSQSLKTNIFDTTVNTNSEVEQLNLLNISDSQEMQEAHAQGQLQACMAAQTAVQNMDQRNAASLAINDASFKYTQQASNPTYPGKQSSTWTSYY